MTGESLIGQEVTTIGPFSLTWEIERVYEGADGITYARLHRQGDESSIKTLALKALMDRRRFQWVGMRGQRPY